MALLDRATASEEWNREDDRTQDGEEHWWAQKSVTEIGHHYHNFDKDTVILINFVIDFYTLFPQFFVTEKQDPQTCFIFGCMHFACVKILVGFGSASYPLR